MVLNLKAGDTVRMPPGCLTGASSFELGPFRGAGNAKHVYALADRPEALALPFSARDAGAHGMALRRMRRYVNDRPATGIEIYDHGPNGEFALIEHVPGSLTGDVFLKRTVDKLDALWRAQPWHHRWLYDQRVALDRDTAVLQQALLEALAAAGVRRASIPQLFFAPARARDPFYMAARQFLLDDRDGERRTFRQVDWDRALRASGPGRRSSAAAETRCR